MLLGAAPADSAFFELPMHKHKPSDRQRLPGNDLCLCVSLPHLLQFAAPFFFLTRGLILFSQFADGISQVAI